MFLYNYLALNKRKVTMKMNYITLFFYFEKHIKYEIKISKNIFN